jgi:hypothetical protein
MTLRRSSRGYKRAAGAGVVAVREKEKTRKGFIPNMKRPGRQFPPPPPMPKVSLSTYRRILGVLVWAERVKGLSQQASMLNLKVEVLFGIV